MPAFLLLGAAFRAALALRTPVINTDAYGFLAMAAGFLEGDLHAATRVYFHSFYPGLMALGGGSPAAGVIVSIIAGVMAGLPLYLLVRDAAGLRPALAALLLYEMHPSLIDTQSDIFADGLFMFFVMSALSGSLRFRINGSGAWWLALGCAGGWLTKSEGIIISGLAAATLCWTLIRMPERRAAWKSLVLPGLAALVIVGAYVTHLSLVSNRLRLSPKPIAEMAIGMLDQDEESGVGKWYDRRREYGRWGGSLLYLSSQVVGAMSWPYLAVLAAALVTWRRWSDLMKERGWVLLWGLLYALAVWFTNLYKGHSISERYLNPPSAILAILAGAWIGWLAGRADLCRLSHRIATAVAALILLGAASREIVRGRRADQIGYRLAGEWILRERGPGAIIASSHDKPVHYARGRYLPLEAPAPVAEAEFLVFSDREARKKGWDLAKADFSPFVEVARFPNPPEPGKRTLIVYRRPR